MGRAESHCTDVLGRLRLVCAADPQLPECQSSSQSLPVHLVLSVQRSDYPRRNGSALTAEVYRANRPWKVVWPICSDCHFGSYALKDVFVGAIRISNDISHCSELGS